jgi:hypothetical protein
MHASASRPAKSPGTHTREPHSAVVSRPGPVRWSGQRLESQCQFDRVESLIRPVTALSWTRLSQKVRVSESWHIPWMLHLHQMRGSVASPWQVLASSSGVICGASHSNWCGTNSAKEWQLKPYLCIWWGSPQPATGDPAREKGQRGKWHVKGHRALGPQVLSQFPDEMSLLMCHAHLVLGLLSIGCCIHDIAMGLVTLQHGFNLPL